MRPINLHVVSIFALIAICCTFWAAGYQISVPSTQLNNDAQLNTLLREKRELENFEEAEFSAPQQEAPEDPGFWDRVVRVAIKLFSKFVEWLNS